MARARVTWSSNPALRDELFFWSSRSGMEGIPWVWGNLGKLENVPGQYWWQVEVNDGAALPSGNHTLNWNRREKPICSRTRSPLGAT